MVEELRFLSLLGKWVDLRTYCEDWIDENVDPETDVPEPLTERIHVLDTMLSRAPKWGERFGLKRTAEVAAEGVWGTIINKRLERLRQIEAEDEAA